MEIRRSLEDHVNLVELIGRLDELSTAQVEKAFTDLLGEGPSRVVLDLTGVEYISSSGLRVLLMFSRAMQKNEGRLKLSGLSPFVAEVFEVSNFSKVFDIYPDGDAALGAFSSEDD